MQLEAIGIIRTGRVDPAETPVQASANLGEQGVAQVDDRYLDALGGLAQFSHAWLLTWLGGADHTAADVALRQRPFLRPNGPPMGIFAMRGPRRPNPIGLSLVEIVAVEGPALRFRGVDMVDGTPLLDIKPYFTDADQPTSAVVCGWFDEIVIPDAATPSSLRGDGQATF
jgi:tRNA-Thr(GGU) m(6)t(6)A37 methyltransferase TsaA